MVRNRLVSILAENLLFPFARLTMKRLSFPFTIEELTALPPQTIGYALGMHMRRNKIEFIPGFESHDIKHMLSGYSIEVSGEIKLAAFELGNGICSPTNFLVLLFGIFVAPDCWVQIIKAFRKGRNTEKFENLSSVAFLLRNLSEVRKELGLEQG